MFNLIQRLFTISIIALYITMLFLLPLEWHKISYYSEIFPAIDLIIIYYLMTYYNLKNWHLFIYGMLVDQLYNFPLGSNSIILILSYQGVRLLSHWFLLRDYFTNLIIFYVYCFFVILSRYLVITIKSAHHIEGFTILFYFLTTILFYPIARILIEKPIQKLHRNAG